MDEERLKRALREANAELLRRIEELSLVRLVGETLAGTLEPASIGAALVALLRDEVHVDLAALWTVDELGSGLRLTALYRSEDDAPARGADEAPLVPFSAGALGTAGAGQAVRLDDVATAGLASAPPEAAGMGSLLCYPVGLRGRTLGVVVLGSAVPRELGPEHDRLLGLIAPVVAMALESAMLCSRVASENRSLRAELGTRFGPAGLIGSSPAFRPLLAMVERLAEVDVTVCVLGASGTGKEMVARALHYGGRRREGPFIALNCAALPETLLESELFGIERGVATGVERRPGLVERASGGTLFLDEVGDMSPTVQAKMLRVLQEREVTRVGGARRIPVDVRVIAATNQDLERAVREGRFREDLYFRLKVATIQVPNLAERREDIPLLAHHFLARFSAQHGRSELRLSQEALGSLLAQPWPGNVRELENTIERAVVMAEGPMIETADLFAEGESDQQEQDRRRPLTVAVHHAERAALERALATTGQNRTRAAALLGISRRTLLYKLKRYGVQ